MSESRAHPRYAVEIDAEVYAAGRVLPVRTRNVSHGGLSFFCDEPMPVGQEVTMTLALVFDKEAMSEPLPLNGRVVWCSELTDGRWQLGAMFIGLRSTERLYLEMFLRYLEDI